MATPDEPELTETVMSDTKSVRIFSLKGCWRGEKKKKRAAICGIDLLFGKTLQVKCNMMFICRAINLITKITVNLG